MKDTFLGAQPMTFVFVLIAVSCLEGRNIPLLKDFDTLINSGTAAGHPPNSAITLEAIKCALSEKQ